MSETANQERPDGDVPWPKSLDELTTYVEQMRAWPSDPRAEGYGACVYAMSNAALATFRYVSSQLRVTGFLVSCAELQFVADSRKYTNGVLLLDAEDLLYPQYDLRHRVDEWIEKSRVQLAPVAAKKLAETGADNMSAKVRARWEEIAALAPPEPL